MLTAIRSGSRHALRGHGLIELMTAIALGLFLVSGLAFLLFESARNAQDAVRHAQLRQSLLTVMSVISAELRRAGYWSGAGIDVTAAGSSGYGPLSLVDGHCILYSYDQEHNSPDGRPAADDQHGLRLANGAVQIKTSDSGCGDNTCLACDSGTWFAVNDPQTVAITGLAFDLESRVPANADAHPPFEVREVRVSLAGVHRQNPAIAHRLHARVNVRNDRIH